MLKSFRKSSNSCIYEEENYYYIFFLILHPILVTKICQRANTRTSNPFFGFNDFRFVFRFFKVVLIFNKIAIKTVCFRFLFRFQINVKITVFRFQYSLYVSRPWQKPDCFSLMPLRMCALSRESNRNRKPKLTVSGTKKNRI